MVKQTDRKRLEATFDFWEITYHSTPHGIRAGMLRFHFNDEGEINRIFDYRKQKAFGDSAKKEREE